MTGPLPDVLRAGTPNLFTRPLKQSKGAVSLLLWYFGGVWPLAKGVDQSMTVMGKTMTWFQQSYLYYAHMDM